MSLNNTHINDDVLVKYLLGEADTNERISVENWINADVKNLKYYKDFKLLIEKSEIASNTGLNEYDALERLHNRMRKEHIPTRTKGIMLSPWIRIAASIVLISALGWLIYSFLLQPGKRVDVQTASEIRKDTLPDGSMVTLNKNSLISYPSRFSGKYRSVQLKGEAFFKVESNKNKPFVIQVNDVTITVVGTAFNVRSRDGETEVVVESGIVKVNKSEQDIALKAGEKVRIRANETNLLKELNNGKLYNYYYSNELICNKTPLHELVETLNEKFNAKIVITKPSLKDLPISTVFRNESLDQILQVISETFNIRIEYGAGQQILLK